MGGVLQDGGQGAQQEAEQDAEDQQGRPGSDAPGNGEEQQGDQRGAGKGGGDHRHAGESGPRCAEQDHGASRSQPRPAADAEDVRVGQRIAEQALHPGSCYGQRTAAKHRRQDPRNAEFP